MADSLTRAPADRRAQPGVRVTTAAGVLLVAYSYLFALWCLRHGYSPDTLALVRGWVNQPTGIGEDFGYLGTALLLLAAGHTAAGWSAARPRVPVVRLARRVLPAVVGAAAVAGVLSAVGAEPLLDPEVTRPIAALALVAVLVVVLGPLLRSTPWLGVLLQLEVVGGLLLAGGWAAAEGGPGWLVSVGPVAALAPLPVLGQVFRLVGDGRLRATRGVALGVPALFLLVAVDWLYPELAPFWRPLGAVYALLLFVIALPRGAAVAALAPVRWLSDRAWPLFLAVPVAGYPVAGMLHPELPLVPVLLAGLVAAGVAGEALHRLRRTLA